MGPFVFSSFILLAFLSDVKVLSFHCQYARHVLLSSIFSCFEFRIHDHGISNISARLTHWGALKRKTAAFIPLFVISHPRFYGLAAWAVFYVPDLFGVCHLLLVLWAYSYLCRFISTTCIPRVTQIGPWLCFGWFFLVRCFTRFEKCVVIS